MRAELANLHNYADTILLTKITARIYSPRTL